MATEIVQPMDDRVDGVPPTDAPTSIVPPMEGPPSELRPGSGEEEGVEVVMDSHGKSAVVDRPDQNVFRAPHPVRPRAMRVPPHVKSSESYGYPPHGAPSGEYGHRPYPVPYANSGSFDEGGYQQHPPASHYSPHVQYPPPSGRHPEDVNVISPSHSTHKGGHRPPGTPSRHYGGRYQYPPTSPVSRPMGTSASPPRNRGYMRRPEGPYSAATRGRGQSEDGSWNHYDYSRPPLVTESSFDSDHYSSHASHSHPTTPNAPHYGPPPPPPTPSHRDPHYRQGSFYNSSFGGSFDSHAPQPPPPHFDDYRYYGHSPHHAPESPYSPSYSHGGYSQSGYYDQYSPYPEYGHHPRGPYDDKRYGDYPHAITPNKKDANTGMLLPKAAQEIDFEVTDPPMEPTTPPSKTPLCESPADVNSYDVLCGRGGGTNSQIGNRRFRQLVQEFQPIYLLARRKEKPLLARTIVLIIRKRGGRFLKKDDETGELFEVGDAKAEAKTSQALREGLDVRATKNAASTILDKKKKKGKNGGVKEESEDETKPEEASPEANRKTTEHPTPSTPQSPPVLPRLNGDEKPPAARPPSPEHMQFRKRRRMRSADAADQTDAGCVTGFQDKFFSDFCPPRADLGRVASPPNVPASHYQNHHHHPHHNHPHHSSAHPMDMDMATTPTRSNSRHYDDDDDDIRAENAAQQQAARGCAGIAMDMVTGAATGSFCLGPRNWR